MLSNDNLLYLLKDVDLDAESEHTIDFDNQEQQQLYFDSKIDKELINTDDNADFKYIREQQAINVAFNIDALFNINYLMYNNDKKWYYAYIIRKEFVNPKTTKLYIKLDVYQTFMFDFDIDECYVEREHQDRWTTDKKPIFNIEPEQLERGQQFLCKNIIKVKENIPSALNQGLISKHQENFDLYWVTIIAHEPLTNSVINDAGVVLENRMPTAYKSLSSNVYTYVAPMPMLRGTYINAFATFSIKRGRLEELKMPTINYAGIKALSEDPKVISINISRYAPIKYDVEYSTTITSDDTTLHNYTFKQAQDTGLFSEFWGAEYTVPNSETRAGLILLGYIDDEIYQEFVASDIVSTNVSLNIENLKSIENEPKLLTSDYRYLKLEYGNENIQLNIEDLNTKDLTLKYKPAFSVKNSVAVIPKNYKNMNEAYTDVLTFDSTYNELPLRTDAWQQYLSTNKNAMITGYKVAKLERNANIANNIANGAFNALLTGNIASSIINAGASSINAGINHHSKIKQMNAQIKDIKETPDKVQNTSLDMLLDFIIDDIYIKINIFEIREEYKKKIFNYFYHYGYSCNDFKTPNLRSRYYFNYIKTIDANIKSNISNEYIMELKALFDKGITIWHYRDAETFKGIRNYAYENVEMALMPVNE